MMKSTDLLDEKDDKKNDDEFSKSYVIGRVPLLEALESGLNIDTILLSNKEKQGSIAKIVAIAKSKDIVLKYVDDKKLDYLSTGGNHQGVVAILACSNYVSVEEILTISKSKGTKPFIIIADQIEDPHNLGAIIRTAEACGVDGIIIPKRRSASLTSILAKTSCGAVNYIPVARVTNLASTIELLKSNGVWIYCCDMDGKNYTYLDYDGGVGIVVGSEGKGVSRLIKEKSDFCVSLPMKGTVRSLNAAVAASVVMYEVLKQR